MASNQFEMLPSSVFARMGSHTKKRYRSKTLLLAGFTIGYPLHPSLRLSRQLVYIVCNSFIAETRLGRKMYLPIAGAYIPITGVQLKFIKDKADGVYIYSRRGNETNFSFLAVDTASPYYDNRPNLVEGQPEKREYKVCYFKDDTIFGQESDIAVITV